MTGHDGRTMLAFCLTVHELFLILQGNMHILCFFQWYLIIDLSKLNKKGKIFALSFT